MFWLDPGKRSVRRSAMAFPAAALFGAAMALANIEAVRADPPPWAPAHGYRAEQGHGPKRHKGKRYRRDYHDSAYVHPSTIDLDLGRCNRDVLGAIIGGGTGAAIGSQIGEGDGRTAAIVGGTVIGFLVGGSIGRVMDEVDQYCVGHVLERANTGQTVAWENPDQGYDYQVTPTRTYQGPQGRHCREYQTKIVVGGQVQNAYGTACRQPDGSWERVP